MAPTAVYDGIADWYENEFLAGLRGSDSHPLGIDRALHALLGPGNGTCLEIGCGGTGEWAGLVRDLGRAPVGVDLSGRMLDYATRRLPVVRGDTARLPFVSGCLDAVISVMVHTDMPAYPAVLHEVARVLRPGGSFVHLGVHPCFCGGFADRSTPGTVIIGPGYLDSHWTTASSTTGGVRDKVGASHWPIPVLFDAFFDAGLAPERLREGGDPVPTVLGIRARKAIA